MLKALRIFIFIIIQIIPFNLLKGQNYFVSNLYNNLVFSNPSLASFNNYSLAQLNYRNQWPVDGLYTTYGAALFYSATDLNSNFGIIINHDNQFKGAFTNTSAGLNYAYKLKTGHRNFLLFGISGKYNLQNYNINRLTFEHPATYLSEQYFNRYASFSSGISFVFSENHLIGLSVSNFFAIGNNPNQLREINFSYLSHLKIISNGYSYIYIDPVLTMNLSENNFSALYGCNVEFFNFKTGVLFNQSNFQLNSVAFLLGIIIDNYDFIYTYDLNLSGAVSLNPKMAAHEVTFLRKFQYKGKSKRHGAIKCPKI